MRLAFVVMLFAFSMMGSGCALLEDAACNTVQACRTPITEHREMARNRRLAEAAWERVCLAGASNYSIDYAQGFKDGYSEYLYWGGDGEPPLVAPNRYRHLKYQTPQG